MAKKKKYDKKSKKYRICTVSIGKTAGTQERSEWNEEEKKRYDSCLKKVKEGKRTKKIIVEIKNNILSFEQWKDSEEGLDLIGDPVSPPTFSKAYIKKGHKSKTGLKAMDALDRLQYKYYKNYKNNPSKESKKKYLTAMAASVTNLLTRNEYDKSVAKRFAMAALKVFNEYYDPFFYEDTNFAHIICAFTGDKGSKLACLVRELTRNTEGGMGKAELSAVGVPKGESFKKIGFVRNNSRTSGGFLLGNVHPSYGNQNDIGSTVHHSAKGDIQKKIPFMGQAGGNIFQIIDTVFDEDSFSYGGNYWNEFIIKEGWNIKAILMGQVLIEKIKKDWLLTPNNYLALKHDKYDDVQPLSEEMLQMAQNVVKLKEISKKFGLKILNFDLKDQTSTVYKVAENIEQFSESEADDDPFADDPFADDPFADDPFADDKKINENRMAVKTKKGRMRMKIKIGSKKAKQRSKWNISEKKKYDSCLEKVDENIVLERKSDQTYINLSNFLIDLMKDPSLWSHNRETENMENIYFKNSHAKLETEPRWTNKYMSYNREHSYGAPKKRIGKFSAIYYYEIKDPTTPQALWGEYIRKYPEDKKSFVTVDFLDKFVHNFRLVIWSDLPGIGGSMGHTGQMNIPGPAPMLPPPDYPPPPPPKAKKKNLQEALDYPPPPPPPPPEPLPKMKDHVDEHYVFWQTAKPEEIFKKVVSGDLDSIKGLLDHEATHYINAIRAKGAVFRSKGGVKQFDPTTKEYSKSTEEWQARLIDLFSEIKRKLNSVKKGNRTTEEKIKHIITALKQEQEGNTNKGYRWIIKAFPYYIGMGYWNDMTEKEKTRFENRFYEFAQSLVKQYDFKDLEKKNQAPLPPPPMQERIQKKRKKKIINVLIERKKKRRQNGRN